MLDGIATTALIAAGAFAAGAGFVRVLYGKRPKQDAAIAIFERNPFPIVVKGPDGRYTSVNSAFVKTFDIAAEDLIGHTPQEIWPNNVTDAALASDKEVRHTGRPLVYYVDMAIGDKTPRHWRVIKFPISTDGGALNIGIMYTDVTDEHDRERRLFESELRLEAASEYAGLWDWEIDDRRIFVSPAFKRMLGLTSPAEAGFDIESVNNLFHHDDFPLHRRRLERHLKDPSQPYESIHRLRMSDGHYRWFKSVGSLIKGAESSARRMTGTIVDIHEERMASDALRLSEARLIALFNNAPFAIHFKDASLRMQMSNKRYREVNKIGDEAIGKTALEIFPGPYGREYYNHDRAVLELGGNMTREETADGMTFLTTKFPIRDRDGELIGIAGIEADITDRVRIEQAYRKARDEAESANRAKSQFLANMSHELRTPLNSIIGFSEIVLTGTFGPIVNDKQREYINIIHGAGKHLLELINDILDLSRIESGHAKPEDTDVDLVAAISSVLALLQSVAEKADVRISDKIELELPRVRADERQIKQVFINLLSNAIKFTPSGGHIDISACRKETGEIEICVKDTGIGIPQGQIDRVMEPFAQVADAMTRNHTGTGLGLAITTAIVKQHQGRFELASTPGNGTTACVYLPPSRVMTSVDA